LLTICFAPSLSDSFIFLTLTRLVVVLKFINFRFALSPPLGDFHLQLLLQPPKEAEAHLLTRRFKGSGPRTKFPVRVHEMCVRLVDLGARRGLRFVQAVTQVVEPRLHLLGALVGETGRRPRKFGLGLLKGKCALGPFLSVLVI
jgi:hypothetical protein